MKPEELDALTARAKDLVADSERLRREHQALLKKIADLSKMEARTQRHSIGTIAPWISPALQPPNNPIRPE